MVYFISEYINQFIVLLGIFLGFWMMYNIIRLEKHKSKIETVLNLKSRKVYINKNTRNMDEREEHENITPETLRTYEQDFNKTCSVYRMYIQLIPIFPLLGILGTVSGLMNQLGAENIEGLNVALTSTLWGLVAAIFFKILSLCPGRIVDQVDIMLDNYYDKFDDSIKQGNIVEK